MRSLIVLLALLGTFVFLTVCYSFWVAIGLMYFGGMLAVVLITFAVRNRPRVSAEEIVGEEKSEHLQVEG